MTEAQCIQFYQKPRAGKSGGGVAVLIKANIRVKQIQPKLYRSFEYLILILKFRSQSVRLLIVYRPPNSAYSKYADFENDFTDLLSVVAVKPEELLVLGDFNIHLDNKSDAGSASFQTLFSDMI